MRKPYTKTLLSGFSQDDTPIAAFSLHSVSRQCKVWITTDFEEVSVDNFVVVPRMLEDVVWFMIRTDGGVLSGRDVSELCDGDVGATEVGQYLRSQIMVKGIDVSDYSEYVREELLLREIVAGDLL